VSNPNGYAEWFYQQMKPTFDKRRRAMALLEARADVADIPTFRVKTPLQGAIQILKRHRDVRFAEEGENRPSSIIISTLAAHAYAQEADIAGALLSILRNMDEYIVERNGRWWIANPSDPRENFADYWNTEPARRTAFLDWLETARTDFSIASGETDIEDIVDTLAPRMGRSLMEAAAAKVRRPINELAKRRPLVSRALRRILDAPHRRPASWPIVKDGEVWISSATASRNGFRAMELASDAAAVQRGSSLRFEAQTSVPPPFDVYWQIVNTGQAAATAGDLRGKFQRSSITSGILNRSEDAKYPGTHSIECFIVKNGYCVASSGPFIVNIS
jgi:Adenylyl/Guanylyl and SMODS C-terminal sensor domain